MYLAQRQFRRVTRKFKVLAAETMSRLPEQWQPAAWTIRLSNGMCYKIARPLGSSTGVQLFIGGPRTVEPETTRVFAGLIREANTFFDIGANVGIYTILAKCYNPAVRVVAFEPEEHVYFLLVESVRINGWMDVRAERLALSDFDGNSVIYIPHEGDTNASLNPKFRGQTVTRECAVNQLDTYCRTHGISRLNLLKIDTESMEPSVLRGGKEIIGDCKPDIICEVLKGRTENELTDFLIPFGYRFYHIEQRGPVLKDRIEGDPTYRFLNYLFTTRSGI